jgi:hypothetical protein
MLTTMTVKIPGYSPLKVQATSKAKAALMAADYFKIPPHVSLVGTTFVVKG